MTRCILLDGFATAVEGHGDSLVAADGREVGVDDARHLPPTVPSKILAVHLNYASRTDEFMTKLPTAPTYFYKRVNALDSHGGSVVRPQGCKWLTLEGEGEVVIVTGRTCRNVSLAEASDYIAGDVIGNDFGLHDFRNTDAGSMLSGQGQRHARPGGPRLRERLELSRQTDPYPLLFDQLLRRVEHWNIPTDSGKRAGAELGAWLARDGSNDGIVARGFTPMPAFWSNQFELSVQAYGLPALNDGDTRTLQSDLCGGVAIGYYRADRLVLVVGVGLKAELLP